MARPDDPDVRLLRTLRSIDHDSRSNVSAQEDRLAGLRTAGYRIDGDAASGWRLVSGPAALIADDIVATLSAEPPPTIGREILVFEETDSTNDVAARAGDAGAAEGLVIFAEKQRAGRGRLGRAWESRPRLGLWFSILLRPENVPVERWPELTFCAALAVAETAESQTGQPARIKWPNDVYIDGRKIAGILLEKHYDEKMGYVVVGIGVNILQDETDFAPELRTRAGSLKMVRGDGCKVVPDRRIVAASLLTNLERIYHQWPTGFSVVMAACETRGCIQANDSA